MSEYSVLRLSNPLISTKPLNGKQILIIVENLPVPFDRRVWLEAQTLSAAGAKVSIICPKTRQYPQSFELLNGISIYRHPLPEATSGAFGYFIEYLSALLWQSFFSWRIFLKHGFDVIHGCNPPDLVFLIYLQFKLFGVSFIYDHHDITPELFEAKYEKKGILHRAMLFFERCSFYFSKVSIATNDSYKKIAITRGRKDPNDVFVVRSGPDLSRLKTVPSCDDWKNGRSYMVGYVGVMGEQEGIDLLLHAVKSLVSDYGRNDCQFVLVGGGGALEEMKALSAELKIADYVTFTDRISDEALFEVLSTADVCVNPDRVNDMNDKSTMNKIMEYMAFAKPIVQFDVTEGRVSAQDSSLYARENDPVDLARKIDSLLLDPELRATMGQLGYVRVTEELGWDRSVDPLIAAYSKVLR